MLDSGNTKMKNRMLLLIVPKVFAVKSSPYEVYVIRGIYDANPVLHSAIAPALFYYMPSMALCIALLHAILGVIRCIRATYCE